MKKRVTFFLSFVVFAIAGCSEYNKVLKSKDVNLKYTSAVEFYNKGECYKALPLLEELIGLTRGSQMAEDVYYYHAKSNYCVKDYYLANYFFKSFTKTFSNSPRAEECQFLAALCSYNLSPAYSLDQNDTKTAVDEFQLFLDKYPSSALRDSANTMIEKLNRKLEIKNFEIAKSYVITEKYKAAVSALRGFLKDFPASSFREEALFLVVKSQYLFAEGSIESKKLDRYRATTESYITFVSAFPESKLLNEAEGYYQKSRRQIERLTASKQK
jgi:outer membrane protein assembly factor BamD